MRTFDSSTQAQSRQVPLEISRALLEVSGWQAFAEDDTGMDVIDCTGIITGNEDLVPQDLGPGA